MCLYESITARILTPDGPSENFDVTAGVLQGDTPAPYLFVIVFDYIMRNAVQEVGENIGFTVNRRHLGLHLTNLDFVDDIALITDNPTDAQTPLSCVEQWALSVGLFVSRKKTW